MSLGTGAMKGWWGSHASMRHSREETLSAATSPANGHQPAPSHGRKFSGNTCLTLYLTGSDLQRGWKGQGSKFDSEAMYKTRYDGRETADSE